MRIFLLIDEYPPKSVTTAHQKKIIKILYLLSFTYSRASSTVILVLYLRWK